MPIAITEPVFATGAIRFLAQIRILLMIATKKPNPPLIGPAREPIKPEEKRKMTIDRRLIREMGRLDPGSETNKTSLALSPFLVFLGTILFICYHTATVPYGQPQCRASPDAL